MVKVRGVVGRKDQTTAKFIGFIKSLWQSYGNGTWNDRLESFNKSCW
jgi:hypothetical protein